MARVYRTTERTPEEKERHRQIRERFQQWKPGPDELIASGDAAFVLSHGAMLDLLGVVKLLKETRETAGLSIDDVAHKLNVTPEAVTTLEGERALSRPLLDLYRYADLLGVQLHLALVK
jgi:DNA-binding XRE family transcriptional regulator